MNERPSDLFGIREAAKRLGIGRSTLSDQVRAGKIPNRGTPDLPMVSVVEARQAREENLDRSKQRSAVPSAYQEHQIDLARVKAERAKLDLARALGQVVPRADVEDAVTTAARELRDTLMRRWRVLAVELEGLGAREIEVKGLASDESALAEMVRKLGAVEICAEDDPTRATITAGGDEP
jgi:hypothetical protein